MTFTTVDQLADVAGRVADEPTAAARIVRRLVTAAAVSSTGSGLSSVALGLLTVDVSRDVRWVTGVFVAGQLPWLLLGFAISARVDRMRRPGRALVVADTGRLVVMAACAAAVAAGHAGLAMLVLTAAALGIGEIVHTAATNVLLPEFATGDALARANGHLGAATAGGFDAAGPALGGLVYGVSRSLPFVADAASYLASLSLVRPLAGFRRAAAIDDGATGTTGTGGTGTGAGGTSPVPESGAAAVPAAAPIGTGALVTAVWRNPLLRALAAQIAALGLAQAVVVSILPLYGRVRLGLSPRGYGVFLAVAASGAVAGGVLGPRLWRARRHTATLLLGSGTLAGCVYALAARTTHAVVAGALFVTFSLAVGVANTVAPTLRMEHAPTAARGRVNTLFLQLLFATQPVGALLSTVLVHRYGIDTAIATAGALVVAAMLLLDRPLRRAVAAVGA